MFMSMEQFVKKLERDIRLHSKKVNTMSEYLQKHPNDKKALEILRLYNNTLSSEKEELLVTKKNLELIGDRPTDNRLINALNGRF